MKKLSRQPEIFETLELFKSLTKQEETSIHDEQGGPAFLEKLEVAFQNAKANPARLHGLRAEVLFEYIAVTLGECSFVKHEDAGDIYSTYQDVKPPDFRIILKNGLQLFVEVKNFYQGDPQSKYKIKAAYLDQLKAYAELFRVELKLAVYWTKWNVWTLSSVSRLKESDGHYSLDFTDAIVNNEMGIVGDLTVGLIPPLIFRVTTDPSKPRTIQSNGVVGFTIKNVEIIAGDVKLDDKEDQNLAISLMFFGEWPEDSRAVVENDQLISFDFIFEPLERSENQSFEMIGTMSGLISRQFNLLTAPEGETERLVPREEPGDFRIELPPPVPHSAYSGTGVPPSRKGKQLEVWCFQQVLDRTA